MKAPIEMPELYVESQVFETQRVDYMAATADGRVGGVQAGFPLWSMVCALTRMPSDDSDDWTAFKDQLRGSTRRFYGRDLSRPYPKLHANGFAGLLRAGGGSFDGTASTWSETINSDDDSEVTLTGLPVGFTLSKRDYIGFSWTATEDDVAGLEWHAVVRVVEGGSADSSGDLTVICEPAIPTAVPDTATAYLNKPKCVMALVAEQTSLEPVDVLKSIRGGQIVGIQDIRS